MDKKEKDRDEFLGRSEEKVGSSISPEIHRKAERIARALWTGLDGGLKKRKEENR